MRHARISYFPNTKWFWVVLIDWARTRDGHRRELATGTWRPAQTIYFIFPSVLVIIPRVAATALYRRASPIARAEGRVILPRKVHTRQPAARATRECSRE